MIYFVEFWNAKPEWKALPQGARAEYMEKVGAAIHGLVEQGVKVLTWSKNDTNTSKRADYDYFAIWSLPNQNLADDFQKLVEGAGWYNYFEQTNVMGKGDTAESVIGQLIQL